MATCKECLHYEACSGFIPTESDKAVWHYYSKGIGDKIPNIEERCSTFCNKADVAEVKHGKWIKRHNERTCSECRFIYYNSNDDFNYCPNCGAKMDGGKDDQRQRRQT